jgi:hypothetical protein
MHRIRLFIVSSNAATLILYAAIGAVVAACDRAESDRTATRGGSSASVNIIEEARAFMDGYARDLLAGNRDAIVARYDRTGAYSLGNGHKEFSPYDSIAAQYRGASWQPPVSFEWRDLSFEPSGPDAVVVAGRFAWGAAPAAPPMTLSYTALLRRQDGVLRIRLEDESVDPASLPPRPAGDSVRK